MKRLALALLALAGVGILPGTAAAVVPGPNGPLAFASGRDDGATAFTSAKAQIWMLNAPGGTAVRLTSGFNAFLHRHPTWSPDRTKIAYARCQTTACSFSGPWDIIVQDLLHGGTPQNITNSAQSEDRPAWSPDGTRIAYTKNTAGNNWDIESRAATGLGVETTVATAASTEMGGWKQTRAQWTPDSQSLIYARIAAAMNYDLYRSPADGSNTAGTPIDTSASNDYQPAVSARGDKICFTRDTNGGPNFKDVYIESSTGGAATPLVATTGDEFECAWAPDGTKVAFGRGGFDNGQILMRNANGTGEALVTDVAGRFDGNVDWAPNAQPGSGGGGGGAKRKCGGKTATIVGTPGKDTLVGTSGPDVIVGRAGNDTIRGKGGKDILCGGRGRDRISGGSGRDRISGGSGRDRISGNTGKDRLSGNSGKDRMRGNSGNDRMNGNSGNDRLNGGSGRDRLKGGLGRDRLKGGSGRDRLRGGPGRDRLSGGRGRDRLNGGPARDSCRGGPGIDTASHCERLFSI